jgi:hypothetical protein
LDGKCNFWCAGGHPKVTFINNGLFFISFYFKRIRALTLDGKCNFWCAGGHPKVTFINDGLFFISFYFKRIRVLTLK